MRVTRDLRDPDGDRCSGGASELVVPADVDPMRCRAERLDDGAIDGEPEHEPAALVLGKVGFGLYLVERPTIRSRSAASASRQTPKR